MKLRDEYIFQVRYSEEGSLQDFTQILQTNPKLPTTFATDDDTIAIGVLEALSRHGHGIPEEISLVSFNGRPLCETTSPPLTSIDVIEVHLRIRGGGGS